MFGTIIIEAAINGATTKDRNPHVPRSAEEIARDALACFEAGASIVHNHVDVLDVPGEAAAEAYLEAWQVVVAERPDALLYPTVNFGRGGVNGYDHIGPLARSGLLRLSLCDPGSVNLGRLADGVPAGRYVYRNSFDDVAAQLELCHEHGLGASIAIYEPGWLRGVLAWQRAGRLPPSLVKLYLCAEAGLTGTPFGLPPTPAALEAYLDLLGDSGLVWAVSVAGGDVVRSGMAELAVEYGGHLHLGLEFYGGPRTPTNVELVGEAVTLLDKLGHRPATPDEAAAMIGLPPR
jgi:uncharacterized protein (DUF849 family)